MKFSKANLKSNQLAAVGTHQSHYISHEESEWLSALSQFSMGKDLLSSGNISSYWIDYLLDIENHSSEKKIYNNYVQEIIEQKSFLIASWREIYQIFINLEQKSIKKGCIFASIPCGLMRDFFRLDFSQIDDFQLLGIDINEEVVKQASKLSRKYNLQKHTTTYCCDALQLPFEEQFDLISSCGLNIYLQNSKDLKKLYKNFFKSLKNSGVLLLHFLTIPPFINHQSEWKVDKMQNNIRAFDFFLLQNILKFSEKSYKNSKDMINELKIIGFEKVEIQVDFYGIGAVAVATKTLNNKQCK